VASVRRSEGESAQPNGLVPVRARTDGFNNPVYFVHGYDFFIPSAVADYWGSMIPDFEFDG
jgi:hypothetical protein